MSALVEALLVSASRELRWRLPIYPYTTLRHACWAVAEGRNRWHP